ncbi:MAG: ABC transporter permease [Candidatus Acidiferrales bacterium]
MLDTLRRDLRFAARMLVKNRGVNLIAIVTLALGIGANAAVFSVIEAVLLRPFPFPHAEQLCFVWKTDATRGADGQIVSPAEFLDWREQSHAFSQLSAWQTWFTTLTGTRAPEQVWGVHVTANYFELLRVATEFGRTFSPDEGQPGRDHVVVITHGLWQRRYGGDPALVGRSILIDGNPYTVIGILPARYDHIYGTAREYDLWMPMTIVRDEASRKVDSVIVYGRLCDGVTVAGAQAEMESIFARLRRQYPDVDVNQGVHVVSFLDDAVHDARPQLLLLQAAVGLVLLIACANIASLLLAKAAAREKEMAIRRALGAGAWAMMRQLLAESVLLALAGGLGGVFVAELGLAALRHIGKPAGIYQIPRLMSANLDWHALAFTLAISLATGVLFGIAPAISAVRRNLSEPLKEGGRSAAAGIRTRRFHNVVVVLEVGISLVLLAGAGLLLRSFLRLLDTSPGLRTDHVLTMQLWLPQNKYADPARMEEFGRGILEQVSAVPGVASASTADFLPLSGWAGLLHFSIEGHAAPNDLSGPYADYAVVSPGYFRTMGIPIERGREFEASDDANGAGVVIVSRTAAEFYFAGQDALGQRIVLRFPAGYAPWRPQVRAGPLTIVGIAGDVREWEWGDPKIPAVYLPLLQNPSPLLNLVVRTRKDPLDAAQEVVAAIQRVDPEQPVFEIKSMDEYLDEAVGLRHFDLLLLGVFAGMAVILAAVGLYGVMAYSVSQRTQEIGVRMALGAQPADVLRMVLKEGLLLTLWGLLAGGIAAIGVMRILKSELFGVEIWDPATYVSVALLLAIVAALASLIPARRATRVDPLEALRYE